MKKKTAIENKKKTGKFNGKIYSEDENVGLVEEKLEKLMVKLETLVDKEELKKKCAVAN